MSSLMIFTGQQIFLRLAEGLIDRTRETKNVSIIFQRNLKARIFLDYIALVYLSLLANKSISRLVRELMSIRN